MIPIRIRHALECFYLGMYLFNRYPLPRKPFVERFLRFSELMLLAYIFRHPAVFARLPYPKTPKIGVYTDWLMNRFPNGVGIRLQIMFAASRFPNIYNFYGFLFDDCPRLYRMTLFLAGIPLFLVFFGLFIGLSVTSTTMYSIDGAFRSSVFLSGNRKALPFAKASSTHCVDSQTALLPTPQSLPTLSISKHDDECVITNYVKSQGTEGHCKQPRKMTDESRPSLFV
jgi:hypothetical protein